MFHENIFALEEVDKASAEIFTIYSIENTKGVERGPTIFVCDPRGSQSPIFKRKSGDGFCKQASKYYHKCVTNN